MESYSQIRRHGMIEDWEPKYIDAISLAIKEGNSTALEAVTMVYGARRKDYGPPIRNFKKIAEIANTLLPDGDINPYNIADIARIMMAVKLARIQYEPTHHDSYVDLCGYTDIMYNIQQYMNLEEYHKT